MRPDTDKHSIVVDGELVPIPREGEYVACCDCGLTHLIKIAWRGGKPHLRFWRSPHQTRVMRATMAKERQHARRRDPDRDHR